MSDNRDTRWSARRILILGGLGGAIAAVSAGQLLQGEAGGYPAALTAAIALLFTVLGALVLTAVPGHLVGRLMVAAGGTAVVAVLAASWSQWLPLAWLSQWAWFPSLGLIVLALLVFPTGKLPSRRWRPVAVVIALITAVPTVALAVAALDAPRTLVTAAASAPTPRALLLTQIAAICAGALFLALAVVLGSLGLRWRRAEGDTRQQLACLLPAGILLLVGLVLEARGLPGGWLVAAVAIPVGMAVAVLRYRLYHLDQIVNRTVVWLIMTLLVIVGFIGIVALLRQLIPVDDTSSASLVATGAIVVMFEPLRRRVQHGVNRSLYGERDDPYQLIARIGDLLGRTADPAEVLPRLVTTVTRSLRLPYAALELDEPGGPRLLAEHGRPTTDTYAFDMLMHGETIGRLLVAPRTTGTRFSGRERRLLGNVAAHAAGAVEATRLIRELQQSRGRLVVAREEERRRLRRELHDGLGPALAGMTMQVRAVQKLVAGQPRPEQILRALAEDLRTCNAEMRALVDQLRPPALDTGLAAALRAECRRFDPATLSVEIIVDDDLNGLPAAVEVAAYRIVSEALANVARHARAQRCRVQVSRGRSLTVEVIDDGIGLDAAAASRAGVGLASMRERAQELGGECLIAAAVPSGTAVQVRLPLVPTTRARIEQA